MKFKCKGYINENGNMEIHFPYKNQKPIRKILKLNGKYHKFFEVDIDFNTMKKRLSLLEKILGEEENDKQNQM